MPTSEECERAILTKKILENFAELMERSLPEELIEAGEVTSRIYETVGHLDRIIKKRCKVR